MSTLDSVNFAAMILKMKPSKSRAQQHQKAMPKPKPHTFAPIARKEKTPKTSQIGAANSRHHPDLTAKNGGLGKDDDDGNCYTRELTKPEHAAVLARRKANAEPLLKAAKAARDKYFGFVPEGEVV
jgi:hypothetical protein